ncbi:hypothetical protein MAPG_02065 [Magnaporthiopsis poae ATCC 64411]|uniref:Uncharacterized protein n=1 Tax=Magnaporthiopsis poae (strain ATCC 64411 / 73-15) TaxID=644358 RepID=A0A0C4DQC6_MAGP6|nr:hypothetical protein MAPG_02065 [Magnaporthiopsis poae ATCC 64411]
MTAGFVSADGPAGTAGGVKVQKAPCTHWSLDLEDISLYVDVDFSRTRSQSYTPHTLSYNQAMMMAAYTANQALPPANDVVRVIDVDETLLGIAF